MRSVPTKGPGQGDHIIPSINPMKRLPISPPKFLTLLPRKFEAVEDNLAKHIFNLSIRRNRPKMTIAI